MGRQREARMPLSWNADVSISYATLCGMNHARHDICGTGGVHCGASMGVACLQAPGAAHSAQMAPRSKHDATQEELALKAWAAKRAAMPQPQVPLHFGACMLGRCKSASSHGALTSLSQVLTASALQSDAALPKPIKLPQPAASLTAAVSDLRVNAGKEVPDLACSILQLPPCMAPDLRCVQHQGLGADLYVSRAGNTSFLVGNGALAQSRCHAPHDIC